MVVAEVEGHAQGQRDAQTVLATMDHADIRGLVTAFHLSGRGAACTLATEIILAMLTNPARVNLQRTSRKRGC